MTRRNSNTAQLVLFYVKRIEEIELDIEVKKQELTDVKQTRTSELNAAKESGLNPKVIKQMILERKMDPLDRRDFLTECELYRAACGDLDGRSLSTHARRATFPPPPTSETRTEDESQNELPAIPPVPQPEAEQITSEQIEQARQEGAAAAEAGQPVTANTYPADDPRRSEWDSGWCQHAGSDGMDIPKALRRPKKGSEASNDDDQDDDTKKAA